MLLMGFWQLNLVRNHQTWDLAAFQLRHAKAPRQKGINVYADEKVLIRSLGWLHPAPAWSLPGLTPHSNRA